MHRPAGPPASPRLPPRCHWAGWSHLSSGAGSRGRWRDSDPRGPRDGGLRHQVFKERPPEDLFSHFKRILFYCSGPQQTSPWAGLLSLVRRVSAADGGGEAATWGRPAGVSQVRRGGPGSARRSFIISQGLRLSSSPGHHPEGPPPNTAR